MKLVWGLENAVVSFVAGVAGERPDFGRCRTLAVLDGHVLVGGIVFHNWRPDYGVIEFSGAGTKPGWVTRRALREAFGYAFGLADCQAVLARTSVENTRMRRLAKGLGAQEYIIPRLRGRNASEATLVLTEEAWASSRLARYSR